MERPIETRNLFQIANAKKDVSIRDSLRFTTTYTKARKETPRMGAPAVRFGVINRRS